MSASKIELDADLDWSDLPSLSEASLGTSKALGDLEIPLQQFDDGNEDDAEESFRLAELHRLNPAAIDPSYSIPKRSHLLTAIEWYEKAIHSRKDFVAALQGLAESKYELGLLELGLNTASGDSLAFHWFSEAATLGLSKAHYQLGLCYYKKGIDLKKAIEHFEQAENQGYCFTPIDYHKIAGACFLSAETLNEPQAIHIMRRKAQTFLLKSAQSGDAPIVFEYARKCKNEKAHVETLLSNLAARRIQEGEGAIAIVDIHTSLLLLPHFKLQAHLIWKLTLEDFEERVEPEIADQYKTAFEDFKGVLSLQNLTVATSAFRKTAIPSFYFQDFMPRFSLYLHGLMPPLSLERANQTLMFLGLAYCYLGERSLELLSNFLRENETLITLKFKNVRDPLWPGPDSGFTNFKRVILALEQHPTLYELYLDFLFDDVTLAALEEMLLKNESIKKTLLNGEIL